LLFVAFQRFSIDPGSPSFCKVCGYSALLCLTRYDYAILVLPILVASSWQLRERGQFLRGLGVFATVCVPWLLFSLVYFGTILPNAFYAKLTTAIPTSESVAFGLKYYQATWIHDPTSLIGLGLGVILATIGPRRWQWMPVSLGIVLYLLYIIPAGGDFMIGRFMSVPMLLSTGLLVDGILTLRSRHVWMVPAGLAAYWIVVRPDLPLLDNYSSRESMRAAGKSAEILPRINDEKKAYVFDRGLMTGHLRFAGWLASRVDLWKQPPDRAPRRAVLINCGGLGWLSFEYGPEAHVYDLCALADPFLSKLPLYQTGRDRQQLPWGPGHFTRAEPEGYTESVASGANVLHDPVLADVFGAVQSITTGPLFTWARWRSILRLATLELVRTARSAPSYTGSKYLKGQDTRVAAYSFFSNPFRSQCTPEELAERLNPRERLEVILDKVTHSQTLKLTGTPGTNFHIGFLMKGVESGSFDIDMPKACATGLGIVERRLPPAVAERGFDAFQISAVGESGSGPVHLGGVILDDVAFGRPRTERTALVFDKPACQLPNRGGEVTVKCSVQAHATAGRKGHLTYGPYAALPPGEYSFELDYRSSAELRTVAGQWDAAVRVGPNEQVLARGQIVGTNNAPSTLTGRFWVPRTGGSTVAVEIRTSAAPLTDAELVRLRIFEVDRLDG
jgi:hypothetical protein